MRLLTSKTIPDSHVMLEMKKGNKLWPFHTKGEEINRLKLIGRNTDAFEPWLHGDEPVYLLCMCIHADVHLSILSLMKLQLGEIG